MVDGLSERLLEQGVRSSRTVHCVSPLPVAANEVFTVKDGLRRSGIGAVGDIPWGTHFCHFYRKKKICLTFWFHISRRDWSRTNIASGASSNHSTRGS